MWQALSRLSLLSLASIAVSAKSFHYDQGSSGATIPSYVPGKFIVEFKEGSGDSFRVNSVDRFYSDLKGKGIGAKSGLNYTGGVFEGCSFQVDEKTNPEDILALDYVVKIWRVRKINMPVPVTISTGNEARAPLWSSHAGTGVLDMHKMGFLGEGAVIGVVDSGIDYTNPALGGSVGPDRKILSGRDIVGDNWTPGGPEVPDDDIMDCNGHGTHVAGIIAGEPEDGRFISVAPKAKLRGYKVFGCSEGTDEAQVVAAFIQAYEDGVDIINASIGGPDGWTEGAWQAVADKLVKKGVFICIAASNDGAVGSWHASSGSTAREVLAVASLNNEELFSIGAEARSDEEKRNFTYIDSKPDLVWPLEQELEVYATSTNITDSSDACLPLPNDTPNLAGKLVVVRRGNCTFAEKAQNVEAKGGQYLMFYTDDRPMNQPNPGNVTTIQYIAMTDAATGQYLVRSFAAGKKTSVYFGGIILPDTATGGYASNFTDWGPSWEGYMKPEIAAPGANILSTYLMSEGGYAVLSGTSMATPYIAGIAALYIGKAGGRKNLPVEAAAELKKRIISSGRALNWNDGNSTDPNRYAPIAQIGGGYVNATKVLMYKTSVSPAKIELNDTQYFKPSHYINVHNSAKHNVVYKITHLPVDTFYTFEANEIMPKEFPPNFADEVASVLFSEEILHVGPGTTNSFKVEFSLPSGLDAKLLPVYGGKIVITGDNGERVEVPYLGIGGSIKDQRIWDESSGLPDISGPEGTITGPRNFTLQGTDRPTLTFQNNWGSREIRVDIVTADWSEKDFCYPPVAGKNKFVGNFVTDYGFPFPWYFATRNNLILPEQQYFQYNWTGFISNETHIMPIQPGSYKFNLRALKVFGRPELASDWHSVTGPVLTVLDVPPQEIPESSNSTESSPTPAPTP